MKRNQSLRMGWAGNRHLGVALLVVGGIFCGRGAAPARAGNPAVQHALQANYDRMSAAFRTQNIGQVDSLLAPDATLTTPTHETWSRERILSDLKRQSAVMKGATWQRKVTAVTLHAGQAVATVRGKMHAAFKGQDGKSHTFDLVSLSIDTWVRSASDWKLKHADTRELHSQIDGLALQDRAQKHR